MTADLPAGRELDAEVALRVMGWQRRTATNSEQLATVPPDWTDFSTRRWLGHDLNELVPAYSTDIAAAMQIVEYVLAQGQFRWFDLTFNVETSWYSKFSRSLVYSVDSAPAYGQAPTPALAICRAALTSVGEP